MNSLSPFLTLNCGCDEALQWTKRHLSRAGLRALQTFDLHTARHALDAVQCPCPHHGTEACDCQMVILLVYGKEGDVSTPLNTSPATLILHGNDGQTWLSLAENPNQRADAKTISAIRHALEAKASVSILQSE